MRATKYGSPAALQLPGWTSLETEGGRIRFCCERCGEQQDLTDMPKHDAERALGRLLSRHARCPDREALQPAAREPEMPFTWIRRGES